VDGAFPFIFHFYRSNTPKLADDPRSHLHIAAAFPRRRTPTNHRRQPTLFMRNNPHIYSHHHSLTANTHRDYDFFRRTQTSTVRQQPGRNVHIAEHCHADKHQQFKIITSHHNHFTRKISDNSSSTTQHRRTQQHRHCTNGFSRWASRLKQHRLTFKTPQNKTHTHTDSHIKRDFLHQTTMVKSLMKGSDSRFAHLLEPIRDLAKNWNIDIASELEECTFRCCCCCLLSASRRFLTRRVLSLTLPGGTQSPSRAPSISFTALNRADCPSRRRRRSYACVLDTRLKRTSLHATT
jgi:hypothetical protein